MAQLLLQNRSSGESTSPNLLPSWTFILWNPASSFGRARRDWSLRHHFWEPAGEIHKDTLGEPSSSIGGTTSSMPGSALFATAHDSNLENCSSKYCVKMEGKTNIHSGSQAWSLRFAEQQCTPSVLPQKLFYKTFLGAISCEAPSLPKRRRTAGQHHTTGSTRDVWGLQAHDLQQHGSRPGWFQLS